jgi:hypothetical protein
VFWRPLEDEKVLVVRAVLNQLVLPAIAHVSDEKLVSCTCRFANYLAHFCSNYLALQARL